MPRWTIFTLPFLLVGAFITAGQLFLFKSGVTGIISDGYGYWSYLPSYVILHDPTFATFMSAYKGKREAQGISQKDDGTYIQKYPVGVALLQLPFFLAGDAYARNSSFERDGYSLPYGVASAVGSAFYALIGLLLLFAALKPYYRASSLAVAGLFLLLGTNAYNYTTHDGSFSHIFTFFLGSALLYYLLTRSRRRLALAVPLGLIMGLLVLVRATNAVYFVFVASWLIAHRFKAERWPGLRAAIFELTICGLVAMSISTIQMASWHAFSGKWFITPYENEFFDFTSPQIVNALFSIRKGLFFWTPLYLIALAGLILIRQPAGYVFPATLFFLIHLYVTSSWNCWWYGGTVGQRVFVDALPILYPGIANLSLLKSRLARWGVTILCIILSLFSLLCTWFIWIGIIPGDEAKLSDIYLAWRHTRSWMITHALNGNSVLFDVIVPLMIAASLLALYFFRSDKRMRASQSM